MKKGLSVALFSLFSLWISAQTLTPCKNCDTITSRYYKYHYTSWYDECPYYDQDGYINPCVEERFNLYAEGGGIAKWEYTDTRLKVVGLVALVHIYANNSHFSDSTKLPEYLYLFQKGANDTMIFLDSARWEDKKPYYMKYPRGISETSFMISYAYETYFDTPKYVDSVFYIYGSHNSNAIDPTNHVHYHIPTYYVTPQSDIRSLGPDTCGYIEEECLTAPGTLLIAAPPLGDKTSILDYGWLAAWGNINYYGLFLAIVANDSLKVFSADEEMGSVTGGGYLPDSTWYTIQAIPDSGFVFSHWNDGNTDNPRQVFLAGDTSFTAFFTEWPWYTVQTAAAEEYTGTVEGGGAYPAQSMVTLTALPGETYRFDRWNDGDTANPREFILVGDTSFTAFFSFDSSALEGIGQAGSLAFSVTPNPTHGGITIRMEKGGHYAVRLFDSKGVCVKRTEFDGDSLVLPLDLPQGHYLLRVDSEAGYGVKAVIKL